MSQLAYTVQAPVAKQGLLVDTGDMHTISRAVEESAGVEFGRPMVAGTDPEKQSSLPSATGQDFLGVTVFHHSIQDETLGAELALSDGETGSLLRKGTIWVRVEEAVTTTDDVYYRHTTNGGLVPGGWRTDADTANADQLTSARWLTAAAQDGLAQLEINLP
jgi:hypothetical protein